MTDQTTTVRPTFRTPASGSPAAGTALIGEQQVLFATAAAVALPRQRTGRWAAAIKAVSATMSAVFMDSRPPAQRYVARRIVYLENAVMAREMYRL